ncbi:integral membrane protein [Seiridium cupressi]
MYRSSQPDPRINNRNDAQPRDYIQHNATALDFERVHIPENPMKRRYSHIPPPPPPPPYEKLPREEAYGTGYYNSTADHSSTTPVTDHIYESHHRRGMYAPPTGEGLRDSRDCPGGPIRNTIPEPFVYQRPRVEVDRHQSSRAPPLPVERRESFLSSREELGLTPEFGSYPASARQMSASRDAPACPQTREHDTLPREPPVHIYINTGTQSVNQLAEPSPRRATATSTAEETDRGRRHQSHDSRRDLLCVVAVILRRKTAQENSESAIMSGAGALAPMISSGQVANPSLPHDNFGPKVNVCVWGLSSMAAAWLILRVYYKFLRQKRLWWDDYILIASWLMLLGGNISITFAVTFGFGKHSYDIEPHKFSPMRLVSNFAGTFMIIGAAWSKTAFAVILLRISSGRQKIFIWFIIISVNAVLGVSGVTTWTRCWPLEKTWVMSLTGTCWSYSINVHYNIFTAAYSGLMDVTLALLPWNILWGLSIDRKEKLSALAAMSMGVFAGITSFAKIYAIQDSDKSDIVNAVQLVILATAEISVTIIAAWDKLRRAGPFLALDETGHWTRQRISDATSVPGSPPPVPDLPDLDSMSFSHLPRREGIKISRRSSIFRRFKNL